MSDAEKQVVVTEALCNFDPSESLALIMDSKDLKECLIEYRLMGDCKGSLILNKSQLKSFASGLLACASRMEEGG